MNELKKIYDFLYNEYGPQGWWPLLSVVKKGGVNPTKTGSVKGYHPGNFSFPRTEIERFEIIIGCLLTQNTSWTNVEKALLNLEEERLIRPDKIMKTKKDKLGKLIRPAGYFNQKAERLVILAEWFLNQDSKVLPTREELLNLKGIGPETADSILLYAYKEPEFIVDNYTKRILSNLKLIPDNANYDFVKSLFEKNLEKDFKMFQEFHALLVEHAKRYYTGKNKGELDPLFEIFK